MKRISIFTDGACLGNPGPGGWAALLRYGIHEKMLSGGEPLTTNNRMELAAVIQALGALKSPCQIQVYTDSRYVQQGMQTWLPNWQAKGWLTSRKQAVKNQDLWETLANLIPQHDITWHWVKAHAGHSENERVDQAAREAAKTASLSF